MLLSEPAPAPVERQTRVVGTVEHPESIGLCHFSTATAHLGDWEPDGSFEFVVPAGSTVFAECWADLMPGTGTVSAFALPDRPQVTWEVSPGYGPRFHSSDHCRPEISVDTSEFGAVPGLDSLTYGVIGATEKYTGFARNKPAVWSPRVRAGRYQPFGVLRSEDVSGIALGTARVCDPTTDPSPRVQLHLEALRTSTVAGVWSGDPQLEQSVHIYREDTVGTIVEPALGHPLNQVSTSAQTGPDGFAAALTPSLSTGGYRVQACQGVLDNQRPRFWGELGNGQGASCLSRRESEGTGPWLLGELPSYSALTVNLTDDLVEIAVPDDLGAIRLLTGHVFLPGDHGRLIAAFRAEGSTVAIPSDFLPPFRPDELHVDARARSAGDRDVSWWWRSPAGVDLRVEP